jgi:hypothetical protein
METKFKSFFEKVKQEIATEIRSAPQLPTFCMLGNAERAISEIHFHFMSDPEAFCEGMQMRACEIEADFFITVMEAPMIRRNLKDGEPDPSPDAIIEEIKQYGGVELHPDVKQTIMLYFEDLEGNTHVEMAEVSKDRKLAEWEPMQNMVSSQGMNFLELRRNPEKAAVMEAVAEKAKINPTLH